MRKLISLVIPVYNEEANIDRLLKRIAAVADSLTDRYDFEFVFTDNRSEDRTFELLQAFAKTEPRIRVYRFSRNFGFQRSILTGYLKAEGDAAVQLDADLQDPPELIPQMLEKWEEGHDVVYGVRRSRPEGPIITAGRRFYYWLVDAISDHQVVRDAGDFRLISRRVIDVLGSLSGGVPYIRGTIAEIGFDQVGIPYDRDARTEGESKFKPIKLISFGLDGLIHQSNFPLRLSAFFGFGVGLLGFMSAIFFLVRYVVTGSDWPAGYATLAFLLIFTMMINAFFFAIIGEYLGRMYQAQKGFPATIIDASIRPGSGATIGKPGGKSPPKSQAARNRETDGLDDNTGDKGLVS